jgi:hypothetical protein
VKRPDKCFVSSGIWRNGSIQKKKSEDMAKGVISKFWDRRYMLHRPEMCSVSTEIVTSTEKSATIL